MTLQHVGRFAARNGTFIGLIGIVIVFSVLSDVFLSARNLEVVARQVAELGIICIPLALLVISGSIDLSVGSIATMGGIIAAKVMVATGSPLLGIAAGLGFGYGAGILNGVLISYFRLNPIVITLGFLSVWGGASRLLTNGSTVIGLPASFTDFGALRIFGLPIQVLALALATLVGWWILNKHSFGRQLYAVGGNERAAFLMGVKVQRVRFWMHAHVGGAAALAGIMLTAKLYAAPATLGSGLELTALTVVLLGGVAFAGGAGRISGVLSGLFFVGVLQNGLVITGTSQFLQQVFVGTTLVLAIALDQALSRYVRAGWQQNVAPEQPATDAVATTTS